jgi:hypothetical protein
MGCAVACCRIAGGTAGHLDCHRGCSHGVTRTPVCRPPLAARSMSSGRRRAPPLPLPPPPPWGLSGDPNVLRFAALLPEGHRLVEGAQAAQERRRREEEEARRAIASREARARARAAAEVLATEAAARAAAEAAEAAETERRMQGGLAT